jgi:hypothetical protein
MEEPEKETRLDSPPASVHTPKGWYEEFGEPPRFPYIGGFYERIRELLHSTPEPKVTLRGAGQGRTVMIVSLPLPSSVVPPEKGRAYSKHGVTLSQAFDDVLWQKLKAGRSTTYGEMTSLMMKAYKRAWLQWFRLQFLGHSLQRLNGHSID